MGPLPRTKWANLFIITATCLLTKFVWAKALPAQNAEAVARFLVFDVFLRYGILQRILSDQGTPFHNQLTTEILKLFNVKRLSTSAYHPQTNGTCERFNATLAAMLSKYVDKEQRTWDQALPYLLFAFNSSSHDVTGASPYKLLFGREAVLPIDIEMPVIMEPMAADMARRLEDLHHEAAVRIEQQHNLIIARDNRVPV